MFSPIPRIREFITKARRVVLVSSKPDPDEFRISAKITGLGMVLIGAIGFAVFMFFALAGPLVGGL
jgi:protein transport protein SEC61 subunit gamma-like protein